MRLIQIEPGNGPGTVTVVWEGSSETVENSAHRTILDGTAHPEVHVGFAWDGSAFLPPAGWVAPVTSAAAPTRPVLTKGEFLLRFSVPELVAARSSADVGVQTWLWVLENVQTVDLGDVNTLGAVEYLGTAGVLTADRVAAVLS